MRDSYQIILGPVITEKATDLKDKQSKYVFRVCTKASKPEIRRAVQERFKVRVLNVTTMREQGKKKRYRGVWGRSPSWKKAIVALHPDDKIEYFEGA